jgi:hemerythrin-like domain-containing protein
MEQAIAAQPAASHSRPEDRAGSHVPRARLRENARRGAGRHDLYALAHKGLRACMCDTLAAVGRMDATDPDDVGATVARVRELIELCVAHLEKEEHYLHPAMEARKPGSSQHTARDHVDQPQAIDGIEAELRAIEEGRGDAQELYRRLGLFVAESFVHMHSEETDNNAVLWSTHDDAELALIEREIVASIPPGLRARWMRWMVPAMAPAERARLLAGMKANIPAPAFAAIVAIARPHLAAAEWQKLAAALAL